MSRRKLQWKKEAKKAGGVDKILPRDTKGSGEWLTKAEIPEKSFVPSPGTGKGATVTISIGSRKEELVRKWCK